MSHGPEKLGPILPAMSLKMREADLIHRMSTLNAQNRIYKIQDTPLALQGCLTLELLLVVYFGNIISCY